MVLIRANQFNPVSEWIMNVTASNAGDVVSLLDGDLCSGNRGEQSVVVLAAQRGMRFLRGTKVLLHSKVYLHGAALEPAAAALCQFGRLGNFRHAQHSGEECPRFFLLACRHRQLHVINGEEFRSAPRNVRQSCFPFA